MAYHIARDNRQLGVFEEAEVRTKLASGELQNTDLAWTEGMAEWKPLSAVLTAAASAPASEVNPYTPSSVQTYEAPSAGGVAPLASLGQRLGAVLLDVVVFLPAYIPIFMSFAAGAAAAAAANGGDLSDLRDIQPNFLLLGLGGGLALALVVVNIVMLAKRGQTIGKRIVGIRIVGAENDENPGWVKTIILRAVVNGFIGAVPLIGSFYALADILFIFRQDRRCIHDLLAGTRVVQGQPPV